MSSLVEAVGAGLGLSVLTEGYGGSPSTARADTSFGRALRRPPDVLVLDGDADWDSLLAEIGEGHPAESVPVLVLAAGRPPSLTVAERGKRVVVLLYGPCSPDALAEGLRLVIQAAHRRADRSRARVRDRVAELVDRAPVGVALTDADGRLVWANRAARVLLGLPGQGALPEEPVWARLAGATPGSGVPTVEAARALPAAGWRGRLRVPEGERGIDAWVAPDGGDALRGWSITLYDTPEAGVPRRALEELAHELNNPLALVRAYLDIGLALGPDPAVADALREALAGTDRLRTLVREVPRIGLDTPAALGAVALHPVVRATLALAEPEIRRRARLSTDLVPVPPVLGSESRLGQVLLNLVLNAVQAMDAAAKDTNRLQVSTRVGADGRVCLEVADTGPGLAPAEIDRVFEPFYTTRRAQGGEGLGLYIVRTLVAAMGGEIEVTSRLGLGTRFRVWLAAAAEVAPGAGAAPGPSPAPAPSLRARLLIVDDEPLVARALRRLLASEHDVETAAGGEEVLERLAAGEAYDLILCDLMMPGLGGVELHAALSARHPEVAERMVFLTGGAQNRTAAVFLDEVPNPRLQKPFDAATLRGLVRDVLSRLGRVGAARPSTPPTAPGC